MAESEYALSIKQPWATLVVHGLKTIEIRSWPTARRGRILIHAARVPDRYEKAWASLPAELREAARLVGGLIGSCELTGCIAYRDREGFAADQAKHFNDPDWFAPPALYGFTLANPLPLAFREYPGWVRFFPVTAEPPRRVRKKASEKKESKADLFRHRGSTE
jgi:ASCH domain